MKFILKESLKKFYLPNYFREKKKKLVKKNEKGKKFILFGKNIYKLLTKIHLKTLINSIFKLLY